MATVEDVVRDLLASLDSDADAPAAVRWIDNRYKQLLSRVPFRHARKVGELIVPAVYATGTVTVSRGSTSVTGSSTSWATTPGAGTHEYWYFKANSAWYKVASIGDDTTMTLTSEFAEDDVSGGSYTLVKRLHPLASDARRLTYVVLSRLRFALDRRSIEEMNFLFPGRTYVSAFPTDYCQQGVDSNNALLVEFYPYCTSSEILHYIYYSLPTTLDISTTIPAQIDGYILKEGALIDLMRFLSARAVAKGNLEAAAFWRNESRAQESRWERRIQEAARTDQGVDDGTFVLELLHGRSYARNRDQRTAHDLVYDRWNWPS